MRSYPEVLSFRNRLFDKLQLLQNDPVFQNVSNKEHILNTLKAVIRKLDGYLEDYMLLQVIFGDNAQVSIDDVIDFVHAKKNI